MKKYTVPYTQRFKLAMHNLIPQHALTKFAGFFAKKNMGFVTTFIIKIFIKVYKIDMTQAIKTEAKDYKTFNDFFTRKLNQNARTIHQNKYVSPADGKISQIGKLKDLNLLQAKGHYYSLEELLANNNTQELELFNNGSFITIYLSPKDYHCVHMPCNAKLIKTTYIPGNLYSVNSLIVSEIPNVFARNERLVCYFDTEDGLMIQILVGATITGSIYTTWEGVVNKSHPKDIIEKDYSNSNIEFKKGDEMGAFLLGSTVINIFSHNINLNNDLIADKNILFGETLSQD